MLSRRAAALHAASTPVSPASARPTTRASGAASTSTFAGRSPPPIFGDPGKVKFVPLTAKERFTALQSGEVDLLSRNTTWTMSRDTSLGLQFVGVNYYDGQGFMVRKSLGSKAPRSSPAPASACRPAPPTSSTSPTTSDATS